MKATKESKSIEVVVIGGGYAGVAAANRLTRSSQVQVRLVNPRADFVERIRLHQLVTGSDDAVTDFADVLAPSIELVVDTAVSIDAAGGTVILGSGRELAYDYLVYAVGSGVSAVPVPAGAYPMASLEEATRLREALAAAPPEAPIIVVGAGPTGIELAAELGESGRRTTLVCGPVLGPFLHPRGRAKVAARLAKLGVDVREGVSVTEVEDQFVRLDDGSTLAGTVTAWTAGNGVPDLARRSGLSTDELGRLLTDETLTSIDDVRILATGDAASASGVPVRMSCQASVQQGVGVAETLLARIAGETPRDVGVGFVAHCLSLGRGAGLVEFTDRGDVAGRFRLAGRSGAWVKERVCRTTVWQLGFEARRPGAFTVPRMMADPGRRDRLASSGGEPVAVS